MEKDIKLKTIYKVLSTFEGGVLGLTFSDILKRTGKKPNALNRAIEIMVRLGFLEVEKNGKIKTVSITEKGQKLLEILKDSFSSFSS